MCTVLLVLQAHNAGQIRKTG